MTRDEKTGEVVECVRKVRLSDLNIYSPKRAADWRISVNLEIPGMRPFQKKEWQREPDKILRLRLVTQPVGTPSHTRRKDRISYSHEEFSIDLTQVTSTASGNSSVSFVCILILPIIMPCSLAA